ncbi:hypothetical protein [Thalassoglobus sp.]|uniref:hypothetical protein n=1 Tax=Thalassoglobus sp. TaxID=2795869 RepID=UPI003AA8F91B
MEAFASEVEEGLVRKLPHRSFDDSQAFSVLAVPGRSLSCLGLYVDRHEEGRNGQC